MIYLEPMFEPSEDIIAKRDFLLKFFNVERLSEINFDEVFDEINIVDMRGFIRYTGKYKREFIFNEISLAMIIRGGFYWIDGGRVDLDKSTGEFVVEFNY